MEEDRLFLKFKEKLKDNQEKCYQKLLETYEKYPFCGAMVALDMGFGKTAISLKFLCFMINRIHENQKKDSEWIRSFIVLNYLHPWKKQDFVESAEIDSSSWHKRLRHTKERKTRKQSFDQIKISHINQHYSTDVSPSFMKTKSSSIDENLSLMDKNPALTEAKSSETDQMRFFIEEKNKTSTQSRSNHIIYLIVVPNVSLKSQWKKEIEKFIDLGSCCEITFLNLSYGSIDPLQIFSNQGKEKFKMNYKQNISKEKNHPQQEKDDIDFAEWIDFEDDYEEEEVYYQEEEDGKRKRKNSSIFENFSQILWEEKDFKPQKSIQIVITTYHSLQSESMSLYLSLLHIPVFIFDEGHVLRNYKSKRVDVIYDLILHNPLSFRLFLSGTFYYNSITDLASISKLLFGQFADHSFLNFLSSSSSSFSSNYMSSLKQEITHFSKNLCSQFEQKNSIKDPSSMDFILDKNGVSADNSKNQPFSDPLNVLFDQQKSLEKQFMDGKIPLWDIKLWNQFTNIDLESSSSIKDSSNLSNEKKKRGRPKKQELGFNIKEKYEQWYHFWLTTFVIRDPLSVQIIKQLIEFHPCLNTNDGFKLEEYKIEKLEKWSSYLFAQKNEPPNESGFEMEKWMDGENQKLSKSFTKRYESKKYSYTERIQIVHSDLVRPGGHLLYIHNLYLEQQSEFARKWMEYCNCMSSLILSEINIQKEDPLNFRRMMICLLSLMQCVTNHPATLIMNRPQLSPMVEKFLTAVYKTEMKTNEMPFVSKEEIEILQFHPTFALLTQHDKETDKTCFILDRLNQVLEENTTNKVLIFSSFSNFLQLLFEKFHLRQSKPQISSKSTDPCIDSSHFSLFRSDICGLFHGKISKSEREKLLQRFSDPSNSLRVLFLTHKCGGVGMNLTAANHVFIVEPTYSYAESQQALSRANRIGQSRNVHVHFFLLKDGLEVWKQYWPLMKRFNQLKWYYTIPSEQRSSKQNQFFFDFYTGNQKNQIYENILINNSVSNKDLYFKDHLDSQTKNSSQGTSIHRTFDSKERFRQHFTLTEQEKKQLLQYESFIFGDLSFLESKKDTIDQF